jgi:hypothetical protein
MASTYISEFPTYAASGTGKGRELRPGSFASGRLQPLVNHSILATERLLSVIVDAQKRDS